MNLSELDERRATLRAAAMAAFEADNVDAFCDRVDDDVAILEIFDRPGFAAPDGDEKKEERRNIRALETTLAFLATENDLETRQMRSFLRNHVNALKRPFDHAKVPGLSSEAKQRFADQVCLAIAIAQDTELLRLSRGQNPAEGEPTQDLPIFIAVMERAGISHSLSWHYRRMGEAIDRARKRFEEQRLAEGLDSAPKIRNGRKF